jgi:hypothetical protein
MRVARIHAALFASVLAGGFSVPALAQSPYDGLWNVKIMTKTGSCDAVAQYPLTVTDGKISAPGSEVSGHVGHQGNVKVSIRGAYANGQLSGNAGSGKWNGASGGIPCSGRWEASRQ